MFRLLSWLFGFGVFIGLGLLVAGVVLVGIIMQDLPDYTVLKDYKPPVTTRAHASDGVLLAEFARERRLFQPVNTMPPMVLGAFLSAEDKDFYNHFGIDLNGVARAVRDNAMQIMDGSGGNLVGASTITQQVAKNFLLSFDQTWDRKIKEALLAIRIESTFTKDEILELYLNEIFLGLNSYGITAAAMNYFDKSLYELSVPEAAYLAVLPKAPSNYHPFRRPQAALERRNWVLDRMAENGYISLEDAEVYKKENLNVVPRRGGSQIYSAEFFTEEVRRQLLSMYGEDQLYGGGLSVRTTLDPELQLKARSALMRGLLRYDQARGFHGVEATLEIGDDWGLDLAKISPLSDVPEWQLAIVLSVAGNTANIGMRPSIDVDGAVSSERIEGTISGGDVSWVSRNLSQILSVGDVVYVEPVSGKPQFYTLRQVPEIEGALVAMDTNTGRVLAMVGGFSFAESQFNRATQAMRQVGSSFKPLVYAAALDNGYSPSSIVLDAPLEIRNSDGTMWRPENYAQRFYGPQTLRRGIELSRNVMTVRLAGDIGMPMVAEYAKRFGVYDNMPKVLSMALGAGETTVLKMTAAYATMANGGKKVTPTLIDRIQNRYGETVYRHDMRICNDCAQDSWHNQSEPQIIDNSPQVISAMTAYQMTSMLEGVVQRGTGTAAKRIGRPVAGKSGTTNDYKDSWFVGYTPEIAVGVYLGFDTPRNMGRSATGGEMAAPIFTDFLETALRGQPISQFVVPDGMVMRQVDLNTGITNRGGGIAEAYKPGQFPNDVTNVMGFNSYNQQSTQEASAEAGGF